MMKVIKKTFLNSNIADFVKENCHKWGKWSFFFEQKDVQEVLNNISQQITTEIQAKRVIISPSLDEVFEAFIKTHLEKVKVLILGQDPAPEPHLADGLAFCVQGVHTDHVPSIQRVLLEVRNEGFNVDVYDGDIEPWTKEGVLLLNSVLTIPIPIGSSSGIIDGHKKYWLSFTRLLFKFLSQQKQPLVYILWGTQAGHFAGYLDNNNRYQKVLKGGHPSPRANSEKFFCKDYFLNANKFLKQKEISPVNWALLPDSLSKQTLKGIWHWSRSRRTSIFIKKCSFLTVKTKTKN